ncbi:hypothetical protein LTR96_011665, partial [Exophiala xenobiotica]
MTSFGADCILAMSAKIGISRYVIRCASGGLASLPTRSIRGTYVQHNQRRWLSIHEYQAQTLLKKAGIPVPRGDVAATAEAAQSIAKERGQPVVLKAQIHAGGRGKGSFENGLKGGVHVVKNAEEAHGIAAQMLGHRLRTRQTDTAGLLVDKLYVVEKISYDKEFYLSLAVDRKTCFPTIVASRSGGTNIEVAAKSDPTSVCRVPINYTAGVGDFETFKVAATLQLTDRAQIRRLQKLLSDLYSLFVSLDATLLEINPLVLTSTGELICLDSKFNFDNAARSRQSSVFELEEKGSRDANEKLAEDLGFSYVKLDGNIGNIVNGAGLAMATNDAVNYFGGECANFLDAGGKATKDTFVDAIRIVLKDPRVKVIFINIYGGIIHGDMVAECLIQAVEELRPLRAPLVVRLQGTSADKGQKM